MGRSVVSRPKTVARVEWLEEVIASRGNGHADLVGEHQRVAIVEANLCASVYDPRPLSTGRSPTSSRQNFSLCRGEPDGVLDGRLLNDFLS